MFSFIFKETSLLAEAKKISPNKIVDFGFWTKIYYHVSPKCSNIIIIYEISGHLAEKTKISSFLH